MPYRSIPPSFGAEGVLPAVEFLRNVGMNENMDLSGKEVAVIGGGNVSMDARKHLIHSRLVSHQL